MRKQPWIHSAFFDSAFILLPAFASTAAALIWRGSLGPTAASRGWIWLALVVGVDVAHVYSTFFRTYFDPVEKDRRPYLFTVLPLMGWLGGVLLYGFGARVFWSALAYLAVYHFVRQQYGFMAIYLRKEARRTRLGGWLDRGVIYLATIYPLLYWHTHLPRNFNWFIEGDFVRLPWPGLTKAVGLFYLLTLAAYFIHELVSGMRKGTWNFPKNLLVLGTALSWYVGIVLLNGDLAFTVTNVVSHGIPYIALIWTFGNRRMRTAPEARFRIFRVTWIPMFLASLVLLAYVEEGLWDGFIWRDHPVAFRFFSDLPQLMESPVLTWLVPLLALPQITHYLLDGFIWRIRGDRSEWKKIAFT